MPGVKHVDAMKQLAAKSAGLTTFINKYVSKCYTAALAETLAFGNLMLKSEHEIQA